MFLLQEAVHQFSVLGIKTSAENIKVIALEYPGHGRKIQQPLSHDPDFLAHQFSLEILAYGNIRT